LKSKSLLSAQDSKVIRLNQDLYASVDIHGYTCMPTTNQNNPLQYTVSFNAPLLIKNCNFSNLEIREANSK